MASHQTNEIHSSFDFRMDGEVELECAWQEVDNVADRS